MGLDSTITLSLDLEPGPGPLAGVLTGGGETVQFTGWIELTALIEARRGSAQPQAPRES